MATIVLKIYDENRYKYDELLIKSDAIVHEKVLGLNIRRCRCVKMCGINLFYLINEIENSVTFRTFFVNTFINKVVVIKFMLIPTRFDTIDYNWNYKLTNLLGFQAEIEHTLSWLSTLGGAFSALGDYFDAMAQTAGKISFRQMQLAFRLQDPQIVSRCKLYFSLSLIQRHHYKWAQSIIRWEYNRALSAVVCDQRLLRMCQGIWAKLQYEHSLFVANKCKKLIKIHQNCVV